jgi:predicted RNA-binding Zn-ribbon protein involved in translation (DUF1610 family)
MTQEINSCTMPTPCKPKEAEIYRGIRDMLIRTHCEAKRAHKCCGKITIDRDHITFNCPLCGDARQTLC